jgi:hypothetical protein
MLKTAVPHKLFSFVNQKIMEENSPASVFRSLSFLRRFAGLNYHAIQSERGQRRKIYEFLLGLPFFILVGIVFLRGRDTGTSTFKLEQFVVCGFCFLCVFGFTRLVLRFTSDKNEIADARF